MNAKDIPEGHDRFHQIKAADGWRPASIHLSYLAARQRSSWQNLDKYFGTKLRLREPAIWSEMDVSQEEGVAFELPPAKRQCTQSPRLSPTIRTRSKSPSIDAATVSLDETAVGPNTAETPSGRMETVSIPGLGAVEEKHMEKQASENPESNGILDLLMQHVESASNPNTSNESADTARSIQNTGNLSLPGPASEAHRISSPHETHVHQEDQGHNVDVVKERQKDNGTIPETGLETNDREVSMKNESESMAPGVEGDARSPEAQPPEGHEISPETAEWEADSSPLESSSDTDTSDLSSSEEDSDEEMEGEYSMLGLEEQARILMQGDAASDDEGDDRKAGGKADGAQPRTAHEKLEEVIPKPDITLTNEKIEELGTVEGIVESTVLVKAKVSGEYQVLESGSLLCLKDRTVVGVVAELFGRVEQPMYTIRFTNDAAIEEAGLSIPGTAVYYVEPPHSTFVFTQPLRSIKGSDASNFHDEEVGDDEMDFSDDEIEAEYKRRLKLKRQGRRDDRGGRPSYQSDSRKPSGSHAHDGSATGSAYSSGAMEMNYDDVDEGYTPLPRPSNLHMMAQGLPPQDGRHFQTTSNSRGNDRRRGRGRGRGHGFDHGRGRGGRLNGQNSSFQGKWNGQHAPEPTFSPQYSDAPTTFASQPTPSYQYQQPFQPPNGPPQRPSYPPYSPSPITPLPATHFDFNPQQPQHNVQPSSQYFPPDHRYEGSSQTQSQTGMPAPGPHINAAFLEALRQHQQQQRGFHQ